MSRRIPSGIWGTGIQNETLLQKITLLAIVGQTPAEPKRHPLKPGRESHERVLTIEQEAEVAGNLAFLSRRSNDSHNVAAVGIEEDDDGEGMVIRVTVNGSMLEHVVVGLSKICAVLGAISKNGRPETLENENLLQQVVRLNSSRIASRLRLNRKYSAASSPLHKMKKVLEDHRAGTEVLDQMNDLVQRGQQLKLMLHPPHEETYYTAMAQVVRMIHDLAFSNDLLTDLKFHNTDKGVAKVIDVLEKIGHYCRATRQLVSAARRRSCHLFRNIRVLSWDLEVPLRVRKSTEPGRSIALLRSLNQEIGEPKFLERFTGSETVADIAITNRLNAARSGLKVHAEIKMLVLYECSRALKLPRIIAASKSSCYLCDLFFSIHGAFQVPATFGRFNNKWILPDWILPPQTTRLAGSVRQFDRMLTLALQQMLRNPQRRPQPVESVIGLSASWSSLSRSVAFFPSVTDLVHVARSACSHADDNSLAEQSSASSIIGELSRCARRKDLHSTMTNEGPPPQPESLITEISDQDLPFIQKLHCSEQDTTSITFSNLTLTFEFVQETFGVLRLTRGEETRMDDIETIDVWTIPTESELTLMRSGSSSQLRLGLQLSHTVTLVLEFEELTRVKYSALKRVP